jgi:uncharacterized protein (DUF1501 family)
MQRRKFLEHSALASASLFVPQFIQAYQPERIYRSRSQKALVVIQLSGGNDGLNTVVPFRNDLYYQHRPDIHIPKTDVIDLNGEMGLHPALEALQKGYDQGHMAILNSVGYPNPDRSHFRSMDIWHTASDSDEYLSSGWLGRYLDNQCEGCASPHTALELDDNLSLALKGQTHKGFAMNDPDRLLKTASNPILEAVGEAWSGSHPDHEGDNVSYLYKTMIETQSSAGYLKAQTKGFKSRTGYPEGKFAQQLRMIAELLTTDQDIHVFYVSLGGFDTHAQQPMRQQRLLQQYAAGMAAFLEDLEQHKLIDDVAILTFSEFGRRVQENASRGTDHGTANVVFLHGGGLKKPGFYNEGPDLSELKEGDLKFEIDFRRVYADLLGNVLDMAPEKVLGKDFRGLGVV